MTRFCFQPPSWANRRAGTFAPLCDARRMQGASWIKVVSKSSCTKDFNSESWHLFQHGGTDLRQPGGTCQRTRPTCCQREEYQVTSRINKLSFLKRVCLQTNWKFCSCYYWNAGISLGGWVWTILRQLLWLVSKKSLQLKDQKFSHQCQGGGHAFGKAHGACDIGISW